MTAYSFPAGFYVACDFSCTALFFPHWGFFLRSAVTRVSYSIYASEGLCTYYTYSNMCNSEGRGRDVGLAGTYLRVCSCVHCLATITLVFVR